MFNVLQVINAARTLAARPHSKVARENMDVFKEAWEKQLQVLTEAVDDITGIEDFLATTGKSPQVICKTNFFLQNQYTVKQEKDEKKEHLIYQLYLRNIVVWCNCVFYIILFSSGILKWR